MGSVVTRGTRDNPKHYVKYRDADGAWKMRLSYQPTKALARRVLAEIEARVARGTVGISEPDEAPCAGELMTTWVSSLINRNAADDRSRLERHLRPAFAQKRLSEISIGAVMDWVDAQRRAESPRTKRKLSEASIRHNLNLLSRFFSWAVERGHCTVNPVRQIPQGRRPQQAQKRDVPWLKDDTLVRKLIHDLPEPIGLLFYLGNRSGLRTGEIVALRMSDLGFLNEGVIRVRYSYDGPLKEDKQGTGKMKWVPAAMDAEQLLDPVLARRRGEGAGPEDIVFPCPGRDGSWYRKEFIQQSWDKAAAKHKVDLTWYEATRHSFTSRNLEAGASLDEVSSALGHSSPVVTKRYYDHFVRKTYSPALRAGLGLGGEQGGDAKVVDIAKPRSRRKQGAKST